MLCVHPWPVWKCIYCLGGYAKSSERTVVIVILIILLCGPCFLQSLLNFVTQKLIAFSHVGGKRANVQYISINDSHYGNKEHQEAGMKKKFIGPGLHLRPVRPDRAWPPLPWALNSVLSACGNGNGRIRPPLGRGSWRSHPGYSLPKRKHTNHPCLWTVSIGM